MLQFLLVLVLLLVVVSFLGGHAGYVRSQFAYTGGCIGLIVLIVLVVLLFR